MTKGIREVGGSRSASAATRTQQRRIESVALGYAPRSVCVYVKVQAIQAYVTCCQACIIGHRLVGDVGQGNGA